MYPTIDLSQNSLKYLCYSEPITIETANDKDELIRKLYNEVEHLRRVIYALMLECQQLKEARELHQADADSEGDFENLIRLYEADSSNSVTLVESDTSSPAELESNSIIYPRQCKTPFSAPPNLTSMPCNLSPSHKRLRRLSLPSSVQLGELDHDYLADCDSLSLESSMEETAYQEYEVIFPCVSNVDEEDTEPQCITPHNGYVVVRPQHQIQIKKDYLSFSSLSLLPHDDDDFGHESSTQVTCHEVVDISETLVVVSSSLSSDVVDLDVDVYDDDDEPAEEDLFNAQGDVEPSDYDDELDFLHPNQHYVKKTITAWDIYARRGLVFKPTLSSIPEIGDFLIPVSIPEPSVIPLRAVAADNSAIKDLPPRCISFDLFSTSQGKKSWFDMATEDEEEEEEYY